jgi:membrane dipeptidase
VSDVDSLFAVVENRPGSYPAHLKYDLRPKFAEPEQVPELTELMLRHGYGDDVVRGILGENWLRVARAVWR